MSACSVQAMSHVGCRLMVASSANTSLPLAPAACGDIARALATKAAMSSAAEVISCGKAPALRPADVSTDDLGLVGSPDIKARKWLRALCGPGYPKGQCVRRISS